MHAAENSAEASGEEGIHKNPPALILDKRQFEPGGRYHGAPGVFFNVIQAESSQFCAGEKADRRAENNAGDAAANEKKRAQVSDGRAAGLHSSPW
jgi:hypothetical protein